MYPILSVIIPCYNNGQFLAKMLDCCLRQTFKEWEVIIVDDLSTDETPQICYSYTLKDSRIKFYLRDRQPKGSVTCRNIGFSYSKGKYVIHFDADDLISNTCFEHRVLYMDNHPNVDYATFPAVSFTDENDIPELNNADRVFGTPKGYGDVLESFLKSDYSFSTWNNIYRREAIEDILWDEKVSIYTDFSFIIPCILKGLTHSFSNSIEADYFYRVNHSNIAMTASFVSEQKHLSTLYLYDKTLNSLKNRDDYNLRKEQFKKMVAVHYERLLHTGNKTYLQQYIKLLGVFYNSLFVVRYSLANWFSSFFAYKKYPVEFFYTVFCDKDKYMNALKAKISGKK